MAAATTNQRVFHEPVTSKRVRELMRQADVYILPSNRYERWGAMANGAMSDGAVLVANERAGAAPVLASHGRTGFLFEDGNVAALAGNAAVLASTRRGPAAGRVVSRASRAGAYAGVPRGAVQSRGEKLT